MEVLSVLLLALLVVPSLLMPLTRLLALYVAGAAAIVLACVLMPDYWPLIALAFVPWLVLCAWLGRRMRENDEPWPEPR